MRRHGRYTGGLFAAASASAVALALCALLTLMASPSSSLAPPAAVPPASSSSAGRPRQRGVRSFASSSSSSSNDVVVGVTTTTPAPAKKKRKRKKHAHTLAILATPHSASARIANEAILEAALSVTTDRLSVVLRTNTGGVSEGGSSDETTTSLTQLRRYAGEVYSMAWDAAFGLDSAGDDDGGAEGGAIASGGKLLDLIVYPQNLPNTPPEGWIDLRPDLSCVCSHDSITGWVTDPRTGAMGSGVLHASVAGEGSGGLAAHVDAVNAERTRRGLGTCVALHVDDWPDGAEVRGDPNVVFLEDEDAYDTTARGGRGDSGGSAVDEDERRERRGGGGSGGAAATVQWIGGTAIPPSSLYSSVCVGGTFDGMHYGHRKLLTLAVSSVRPVDGRLLVGVTKDEMLTRKAYAESIPPLEERVAGVLDFLGRLAPGMKDRVRCVPIGDEYGPPGQPPDDGDAYPGVANDFDALVLSHETLPTGRKLNAYREGVLGMRPLKLLCTQRTEPHGMSSTALRRMRSSAAGRR